MIAARRTLLLLPACLFLFLGDAPEADPYFGNKGIQLKGETYQTSEVFDATLPITKFVEPGDFFAVSYGVPPYVWKNDGGAEYEFEIGAASGKLRKILHQSRLKPSSGREERGWRNVTLPLDAFVGSTVTIHLAARAFEKGVAKPAEGVIWGGLQIGGYQRRAGQPNIILLSIDTLRADHLSLYGYKRLTSPNIDRIASEGVWFEQGIAQAPSTKPSHMSMFTGLRPLEHRIWRAEDHSELSAKIPTLPEFLQRSGYLTQAYTGGVRVAGRFGFARGFARYEEFAQPETRGDGDWVFGSAAEFVKFHKKDKFFLFLHTYEVHEPYKHREFVRSERKKKLRDVYDSGIRYVDGLVGDFWEVLEKNGLADDTILIIVSDHGEQLKTRPWLRTHGHSLYDDQIHIPMIFRYGRSFPARKVSGFQSQHIDLLPTILELTGANKSGLAVAGHSLAPILRGERPPKESSVFSEATQYGDRDLISLRYMEKGKLFKYLYSPNVAAGRPRKRRTANAEKASYWMKKVIPSGGREFYDLVKDPDEKNDLAGKRSRQKDRMEKTVLEFLAERRNVRSGEEFEPESDLPEPDDESREQLRSLGY